ncbi:MAG: class I SAM-dependent methyltransferase [Luteibaculaceae bacterium]
MDLVEKNKRTKVEVRHPWELARVEVVKQIIQKNTDVKNIKNILDVGCGDVFVAMQLSEWLPNAAIYCVDTAFNESLVKELKTEINNRPIFLFKDLNEVPKDFTADLVLLLDVIEHIEHDVAFLTQLKTKPQIDNATQFLITVPAFQHLFCQHDVFLGHYRRYTNKSLVRTIEKSDLTVVKIGYFFFSLVIARLLTATKEKIFKNKNGTTGLVEWNKGVSISTTIKQFLIFDAKFFGFFLKLPGLSNYVLCKING